ncbi:MAG: hypothetical protein AB1758_01315 [Candidatus Eremiobacterota bacterium]
MKARRGIILITSIILAVITVMFVAAALALAPGGLAAGRAGVEQDHALRAAESGVQYALARLRQNPLWRGDANQVVVDESDLVVQEDNGNVLGAVLLPDGHWAQFRFRFNFQDGVGGPDGLDDPTLTVDHPFVSFNNLSGPAPVQVLRADGPAWSVTPTSQVAFQAPVWSVSLAVEGRYGPGLRGLGPANLNPAPSLGAVHSNVVEVVYQVPGLGPTVQEAAGMASSMIRVGLRVGSQAVDVNSKDSSIPPRLRTKSTVSVTGGNLAENYSSPGGEVATSDGTMAAEFNAQDVAVKVEQPADPFYQLQWADVRKASPTGPKIPAGTYVWWQDGSLHYYDMSYADYVDFIQTNPTNAGTSPPPLPPQAAAYRDTTTGKLVFRLDGSLYVDPTAATSDLAIIPRLGAPDSPSGGSPDATVVAALTTDPGLFSGVIQSQLSLGYPNGDLEIQVLGQDAFEAEWDYTQTPVELEVEPNKGGLGVTEADVLAFLINPADPRFAGWTISGTYNGSINTGQLVTDLGLSSGNGKLNLTGVSDSLTASDLEVSFNPAPGTSVILSGDGNIRLTGNIQGQGGSITAGGEIRVVGLGADFAANPNFSEGVNMYARGDIIFSTLDETLPGQYEYQSVKLRGVVYTWGDFVATLGSDALPGTWGSFFLEGTLIAYGGDPALAPGTNGKGLVDIRAEQVDLTFDPSYLGALALQPPAGFTLKAISWSVR